MWIEAESFKRISGHVAQRIVLHDEIAEAVKDRLLAIDLDAHENMRAMAGKNIGTRIDTAVSEVTDEVGLHRNFGALLRRQPASSNHVLVVQAHDYPIGLAPRLANLAQILFHVVFVAGGPNVERVAKSIAVAAVFILDVIGSTDLRFRMKTVIGDPLALPVKA